MGTNFYLRTGGGNKCEHCGRSDEIQERHIGKSSAGWCFSLRVYPDDGINDLCDWIGLFHSGRIFDEYGDEISSQSMMATITERKGLRALPRTFHQENDSEAGPNNLARHRIGRHCVRHGAGTWDCIDGEFS